VRNPPPIPAALILDPLAAVPTSMGKRARQQLSELREAYQLSMRERMQGVKMNAPETIAEAFTPFLGPLPVEHMAAMALGPSLKMLGAPSLVTRGDTDGVDAPLRAILRNVLVLEAVSFAVAHNHPSGDPTPSAADEAVTKRLVAAGRAVDCLLVDHLIISRGGAWTSLRRDRPDLWR